MPLTLGYVVEVRSLFAIGLRAYLDAVVRMPDEQAPLFLAGRKPSELHEPPDVIKLQPEDTQGGPGSPHDERWGSFARQEPRGRRVSWSTERPNVTRAVVLGAPGQGKTLLAQMTARDIAQESIRNLDSRSLPLRELAIPVFLRLADVAEAPSLQAAAEARVRKSLGDT